MKKVFMSLAVVALMLSAASCKCCNDKKAAEEPACTECADSACTCCDSTTCAACDSTAVVAE